MNAELKHVLSYLINLSESIDVQQYAVGGIVFRVYPSVEVGRYQLSIISEDGRYEREYYVVAGNVVKRGGDSVMLPDEVSELTSRVKGYVSEIARIYYCIENLKWD